MKTFLKIFSSLEKKLVKINKSKKRKLVITISGEAGVGKTTVGKILSSYFDSKLYNIGDKQRNFAKKRKISLETTAKSLPQKVDFSADMKCLESAIKGGAVLVGRLTGLVAGSWADCRVLVTCKMRARAGRLAKKLKIPFHQAEEKIRLRDKRDKERYKAIYGIDPLAKKIYNLTIDNTRLTFEELKEISIKKTKIWLKKTKNKK